METLLLPAKRKFLKPGEHLKITKQKIKEALSKYDIAVMWSSGKDSTVVLHEALKINRNIPVYFIDSHEFPETYEYVEWAKDSWNLNLKIIRQEAIMLGGNTIIEFKDMTPDSLYDRASIDFPEVNKNLLYWLVTKIIPLNTQVKNEAILTGMRWDEDMFRQFLKYEEDFIEQVVGSTKKQKRVHPILHWSEKDVHDYLDSSGIRKNPLYLKGYRSIGDRMTTTKGDGSAERSGRSQDLKTIVYMATCGYLQSIN